MVHVFITAMLILRGVTKIRFAVTEFTIEILKWLLVIVVAAVVVGLLHLEIAKELLSQNPTQIIPLGAFAFSLISVSSLPDKKRAALLSLVIATVTLSACAPYPSQIVGENLTLPTETSTPKPTENFIKRPISDYPTSSINFLPVFDKKYQGLSFYEAVKRQSQENYRKILELGFGERVGLLHKIFAEKISELTGIPPEEIENMINWEYYMSDSQSWIMLARDKQTGLFYVPLIKEADGCGLEKGSEGLIDLYIPSALGEPGCSTGDFFSLELLELPEGLGEANQVVLRDSSGWLVLGVANETGSEIYLWYDVNTGWVPSHSFKPDEAVSVSFVNGRWVALDEKGIDRWFFDQNKAEWMVYGMTEEEFNSLSDKEKQQLWESAPAEIDGFIKSNFSELKPYLIIYRDSEGKAVRAFNLLTKEDKPLKDLGIIEFNLDTEWLSVLYPRYAGKKVAESIVFVANPDSQDDKKRVLEEAVSYILNQGVAWGSVRIETSGYYPLSVINKWREQYPPDFTWFSLNRNQAGAVFLASEGSIDPADKFLLGYGTMKIDGEEFLLISWRTEEVEVDGFKIPMEKSILLYGISVNEFLGLVGQVPVKK